MTKEYADGHCFAANNWAEWIYLPNVYGDETWEELKARLRKLENTDLLGQQQKDRICHLIFPSCKSNQESRIQIGKCTQTVSTLYRQYSFRYSFILSNV